MKTLQLEELINKIFSYFNTQKKPSQKQQDIWFEDLGDIPIVARKYIYDNIKKNDNIPRNIPKAIKAIYYQWRSDNPDKVAYQKIPCDVCGSSGGLCFQIKGYDFMCRCGHCTNWRGSFGEDTARIYTIEQIEEMGGLVIKTPYDSAFGGKKKRDIKPLLKNLTKPVS